MEKGEEICAFWLTKHSSPARALRTGNASLATHEPGTQVPLLPLAASRNAAQVVVLFGLGLFASLTNFEMHTPSKHYNYACIYTPQLVDSSKH